MTPLAMNPVHHMLNRCSRLVARSADMLRSFSTQIDVISGLRFQTQPISLLAPPAAPLATTNHQSNWPLVAGQYAMLPQIAQALAQIQQHVPMTLPDLDGAADITGTAFHTALLTACRCVHPTHPTPLLQTLALDRKIPCCATSAPSSPASSSGSGGTGFCPVCPPRAGGGSWHAANSRDGGN